MVPTTDDIKEHQIRYTYDKDGSADAVYRYTDFGETTVIGEDEAENEVCYTGGIYDKTTGLYYLNARYYDPEDGRLGGDGIGIKYWNKGLFRKGSYTYKNVTIKYGTTITVKSISLQATRQVIRESATAFAQGAARTTFVNVMPELLKKCKKYLKK